MKITKLWPQLLVIGIGAFYWIIAGPGLAFGPEIGGLLIGAGIIWFLWAEDK